MAKPTTDGVSSEHFRELNEDFYRRPTSNYLRTRIGLLMAIADENAWLEDGVSLARLLGYAADRVSNGAQGNNALKHGLATFGANPSLTIGSPQSEHGVILELSGPAFSYVAWERQASGRPLWMRHTTFIALEQTVGLVATIVSQLDALRAIARARYLGDRSGKFQTLTAEQMKKLLDMPTGTQVTGLRGMTFTQTFAQVRD